MTGLPIVAMTLYKHGVGFFQRQGAVEEDTCTLSFRTEEMNDVLKSLTAITSGDGQVAGIEYESPEDKAGLLARSSIHLSDDAALRDLLRDLRGRVVEIAGPFENLAGTVIGIDLPSEREAMAATLVSVLVGDTGEVKTERLGNILAILIKDERAVDDLEYVLGMHLTDQDKRAVTIRLTEKGCNLAISYIAPSPTWRVSYRLVAEESDGKGQGVLQGWGHFDNTLDEDLENVQIKLVAGMPVSFIYDLYTPFTPSRPTVTEEGRTVAAPVEFEAALPPQMLAAAPRTAARGMMMEAAAMPEAPRRFTAADVGDAALVAARGETQGEFFGYVVTTPVTVRRGRAAIVPILQTPVTYARERIYNGSKHPGHPVATARFKNDTGLTLERGPAIAIEEGQYAGEAMMPFTRPGGDIRLAYAVDLAVRVTETPSQRRELAGVSLKEGFLVIEEYDIRAVTYRVENHGDRPATVIIEHRKLAGYTPFETQEPIETTADFYRYPVTVEAQASAEFTARQRQLLGRREEIRSQKLEQLQRWLRARALDEAAFERIRGLLALYDRIGEHEAALKTSETRRNDILAQQKVVQGNLGALRTDGEEGKLRARYARTLAELEDEVAALRQKDEEDRQAIADLKREIEAALAAF